MVSKFTLLFFFIMFMIGTDTFLIAPLLPTLQGEFHVSTERAGWMIGAYTLGSAVFALIAGPLSDGWNRRIVLLCGLLGFSLATMMCGMAEGFWSMCLYRFLAGVSAAFTAPQVWASIPSVMPPSHISRTMGVAFSGLAASQALGVPLGSWLAVSHWSIPFWTIGTISLLLAPLAYFSLPDIKPATGQGITTPIFGRYLPLLTSSKARHGFLAYLLLHLGSGTAFAFVGKWLADQFALPVGPIGTVMMFLGLGTLIGSLLSSVIVQKWGRTTTFTASMIFLAVLYTGSPLVSSLPLVTMLFLIIFATLGVIFPLTMEVLTSLHASIRGTISSLANSTMNTANTLGAWIAGFLYVQIGGYPSIGVFASICLTLSLAVFVGGGVLSKQTTRKAQRSPQENNG